jgi:hypothetical protein
VSAFCRLEGRREREREKEEARSRRRIGRIIRACDLGAQRWLKRKLYCLLRPLLGGQQQIGSP